MKRFFILFSGILLSAGLGMMVSRYTLAFTSNETVTDRIFEEAGVSPGLDATDPDVLKDLALSGDFPFQNLYLYMYQNVLDGPGKAAVKVLATQAIGGIFYSEDDLTKITQNGDTAPILSRQKQRALDAQSEEAVAAAQAAQEAADAEFDAYLSANASTLTDSQVDLIRHQYETTLRPSVPSQDDVLRAGTTAAVLNAYTEIMDLYGKELDLQRNNRKLAYEALANEMFLNNDLTDSANIDLLYDLDLAHYVLFGSYITYPERSDGEAVDLASVDTDVELSEVSSTSATPDSAYACLDDAALREALEAFADNGSGATGSALTEDGLIYPDPEEIAGGGSSIGAGSDSATAAAEAVKQGLQNMQSFLMQLNGKKGDWTRHLPCGDVFCITVNLSDETDSPVVEHDYAQTDNCIACHVAYISDALNATMDYSLVPGKVSTNWFEDATCKDAGNSVNLDLNVYAIKRPIDLDPGDDIDAAAEKDLEDLKQTLIHIGGFPSKDAPETVPGKTFADIDCESMLHLNEIAGSPQSLSEVQEDCQSASDEMQQDLLLVYDQTQSEGLNSNQMGLYQQVAAELYRMAIHFRNFQEELRATYSGENAPLPALLSKPYCQ